MVAKVPANRVFAVVSLIVVLLGVNCVPFGDPRGAEVGLMRAADGGLLIRARSCKDAHAIASLRLRDTGERTLWLAEASDGSTSRAFVLGVSPAGFEERTPLRETLQGGQHYVLVVTFRDPTGVAATEFDPGQVEAGRWSVSGGEKVTDSQFDRMNLC